MDKFDQYPHYLAAIDSLGTTDRIRAQRLGVSVRTVTDYKAGKYPRIIDTLVRNPILLEALMRDVQNQQPGEC